MASITITYIFLISSLLSATNSSTDYDNIIKTYYPILKEQKASDDEINTLLAIALFETNGYINHQEYCKVGGCDGGIAHSAWQIHCIDKEGKHWKYNRWKWWLQSKRPDIFTDSFKCDELNTDNTKAVIAALLVYKAYAATTKDPITIALIWHGVNRSQATTDNRRKAIISLLSYVKRAIARMT